MQIHLLPNTLEEQAVEIVYQILSEMKRQKNENLEKNGDGPLKDPTRKFDRRSIES